MSQTTAAPAGPEDLRLVLFGMPAAGKSSLLGALSRASEAQEHLLGGKLIDETRGLAELQQQLYETTPRRTPDEVVPYPVRFEPAPANGQAKPPPAVDAVLMDCDGRVANDLLVKRQALDGGGPEGTLRREVVAADSLVLVVDASAPPAQVEADFAEFLRFVRAIERGRKRRVAVGGLPVFLVLTKCDLLARAGDSPADWMDRIEQRKAEVDKHFREFMARDGGDEPAEKAEDAPEAEARPEDDSPFGRIELHVWATAVKRPQLAGSPAKPREPYGVAELFRQCLTEAAEYRARRDRADAKMWIMATAVGGLLAAMLALIVVLGWWSLAERADSLAARVRDYRALSPERPAERLRGDLLAVRERQSRLKEIREDPQFDTLKKADQDLIVERHEELRRYVKYLEGVLAEAPASSAQTEEALDRRLEFWQAKMALPDPEWKGTRADEARKGLIDSATALLAAVRTAADWYLRAARETSNAWSFADAPPSGIYWADWTSKAQELTDPKREPPFAPTTPLPGDPVLTYASAVRFERVVQARREWELSRARLRRLLSVVSELGVTVPAAPSPLLVFSRDVSLDQCKERLAKLKEAHPDWETKFDAKDLPEAAKPRIADAARSQYETLLRPARAAVLAKVGGKGAKETADDWARVKAWLREPAELAGWRELARVLQKLAEPTPADDPVAELSKFLGKAEFTVSPVTLELEIPEGSDVVPRDGARLVVAMSRDGKRVLPNLEYELAGKPKKDAKRRVYVYSYGLREGRRFVFEPGDLIWATLDLQGGADELAWLSSRSAWFRIERLRTPPRRVVVKTGEGTEQPRIRLTPVPESGVPRVPDLVPDVLGP